MLRDLAHQGLAVGVGHPVLGLDAHAIVNATLEGLFRAFELVGGLDLLDAGLDELSVHVCLLETVCENAKQAPRSAVMSYRRLFNTKPLSNSNLYHIGFMYHIAELDTGRPRPYLWQTLSRPWTAFCRA